MRKYKIAIVEDAELALNTMAEILDDDGYLVFKFANSEGVIECLKEDCPDLIIIDIIIDKNEKEGIELATKIRELESQKEINHIGIMFMTVSRTYENALAANRLHVDYFIEKPFKNNEYFMQIIDSYFEKLKNDIISDPVIKAFEDWIKSIDPNDFIIQTLDDSDNPICYNANEILEQMIMQTEFGVNFKNSISSGTQQLIFSSIKNK